VPTYVALLRGINVSGHNPVSMKDLKAIFEALPAEAVRTYLQSGNVVFDSHAGDPARLAGDIKEQIRVRLGADVAVLVLPAAELDRVAAATPFPDAEPSHLHVTFLAAPPEPSRVAGLVAPEGPDRFAVGPREIYLCCPNGYGRTKLNNAFFERKLAVPATTRNWRTVTTLRQMAGT
jgi:uncharacterized protein (DUF1697 family)